MLEDYIRFEAKRLLDTGDGEDYLIETDKTFYLGWVANDFTSSLSSKHNKKAYIELTIPSELPEHLMPKEEEEDDYLTVTGASYLAYGALASATLVSLLSF